jgi:E3 ubiquitin-protein ligase synoviolin
MEGVRRASFYSAVVQLATSKVSRLTLGNFALSLLIGMAHLMKLTFFGQLREAEVERLAERGRDAVMETCLALTIFREELNAPILASFACLAVAKAFHWLAHDRAEHLQTVAPPSRSVHARIIFFMALLASVDTAVLSHGLLHMLRFGPSITMLFTFEFFVLFVSISSSAAKYGINAVDSASEGCWESRGDWAFTVDLTSDILHLATYSSFFVVVCMHYGLPLHLLRDLWWSYRTCKNRVEDFIKYKRANSKLHQCFPEPTEEQLQASDRICIICRDSLDLVSTRSFKPKRLPCGHLFHLACLRSWFERQQTCPTCRTSALPSDQAESELQEQHPVRQEQQQQHRDGLQQRLNQLRQAGYDLGQQHDRIQQLMDEYIRRYQGQTGPRQHVQQHHEQQQEIPHRQSLQEESAQQADEDALDRLSTQGVDRPTFQTMQEYIAQQSRSHDMGNQEDVHFQQQQQRTSDMVPVILPTARNSSSVGATQRNAPVSQAEHEMACSAACAAAAATKRSLMRRHTSVSISQNGSSHAQSSHASTSSRQQAVVTAQKSSRNESGSHDENPGSHQSTVDAEQLEHSGNAAFAQKLEGELGPTAAELRSDVMALKADVRHMREAIHVLQQQMWRQQQEVQKGEYPAQQPAE